MENTLKFLNEVKKLKIKKLIFASILLGSLIFLFVPDNFPDHSQFQEFLNSASQNEVIIIFNSGGWGNTSLEKAQDFAPIIDGIQKALRERNLNSIVISYNRTKDSFSGKVTALKEMSRSYQNQAEILVGNVNYFLKQNPGKKIIMTGLSNGGALVDEAMEKIPQDFKNNVFAIEAGVPFWKKTFNSENILRLNNEGKDSLSKGEIKVLLSTLFKAPFKWIFAKISGKNLIFSQAIQAPGHEYEWELIAPEVTSFLESKISSL